jgi:hypothetical protein
VAQIFYVQCPACDREFPCHSELWQAAYDLLCPFCQRSFRQEDSPRIVTATGEVRPGSNVAPARRAEDPAASAESM